MYFECHPVDSKNNKSKLYVIAVVGNPARFQSRYNLYLDFAKRVEDAGAILYTVETAFGNRPHAITMPNHPRHIQLRTESEVWHKENMINIGISRLPHDWEYVAWIDADVNFARPDWVRETIQQLQHYHIVQMFSVAQDLGPNCEIINTHKGFVHQYQLSCDSFDPKSSWDGSIDEFMFGKIEDKKYASHYHKIELRSRGPQNWHPGFAWAARREAIDHLGGLVDWTIMGSADRHMAYALIGRVGVSIPHGIEGPYAKWLYDWEDRAERYIRRNIGCVQGLILHHWHGNKKDRRYRERWNVLNKHKFNPEVDLKKDWQGLWQLTEHNRDLRDDLRNYFRLRNEDSIDLDENFGREGAPKKTDLEKGKK